MSVPFNTIRRLALASAFGALFAAPAALAQDTDNYNAAAYSPDATEQVIVVAPDITEERSNVFGHLDKVSMSLRVPFDDLDLTTRDGARDLRDRVRDAARDVCAKLADEYPFKQQPGATKCYEGALKTAMVRADAAIRDARE